MGTFVKRRFKLAEFREFKNDSSTQLFIISTKMDGTSVTMYWKDKHFGVCGRNYEYADDEKCAMWNYAHEHRIAEKLEEHNIPNIAI